MITKLVLPQPLREQILRAGRAAAPSECCGLIEGLKEKGVAQALVLHPARNLCTRPDRFEIDPRDQFNALRLARVNNRVLIGCYHSHPGGKAEPSATDLAGAGEDDFLWLIAAAESLAAFVYFNGRFASVAMGADFVTSSE